MKPVFITLFIVSALLNVGLISGYVHIGSPDERLADFDKIGLEKLIIEDGVK